MTDTPSSAADRERLPVVLAYGLYLIAFTNGLTMLVGFVIALLRHRGARGTVYESHYRNLIIVFLVVALFGGLVAASALAGLLGVMFAAFGHWSWPAAWWSFAPPIMLLPVLALGSLLLGLWYFWRVIAGLIRALDEKPY